MRQHGIITSARTSVQHMCHRVSSCVNTASRAHLGVQRMWHHVSSCVIIHHERTSGYSAFACANVATRAPAMWTRGGGGGGGDAAAAVAVAVAGGGAIIGSGAKHERRWRRVW